MLQALMHASENLRKKNSICCGGSLWALPHSLVGAEQPARWRFRLWNHLKAVASTHFSLWQISSSIISLISGDFKYSVSFTWTVLEDLAMKYLLNNFLFLYRHLRIVLKAYFYQKWKLQIMQTTQMVKTLLIVQRTRNKLALIWM